jgi:hypothetical protein
LDVPSVIGPVPSPAGASPQNFVGKSAQSHAFLPRFLQDNSILVPELGEAFKQAGLRTGPASRIFGRQGPSKAQRLQGLRWQVEDVVSSLFLDLFSDNVHSARVAGAEGHSWIERLVYDDAEPVMLGAKTLVVDAMGARNSLMRQYQSQHNASSCEDLASHIGYVTQIFRLKSGWHRHWLPDPIVDCARHLGCAFVTITREKMVGFP